MKDRRRRCFCGHRFHEHVEDKCVGMPPPRWSARHGRCVCARWEPDPEVVTL